MKEKDLKTRIIDSAFKLFMERGIKAVAMDAIASAVGISKRTLYEAFSSKEELLKYVASELFKKNSERVKKVLENDSSSIIKILLITSTTNERTHGEKLFWHDMIYNYPQLLADYEPSFKIMKKKMVKLIKQGCAEGYFYTNINIKILIDMFTDERMRPNDKVTAKELVSYSVYGTVLFLRAISTPKGMDILDEYCIDNNINIITSLR